MRTTTETGVLAEGVCIGACGIVGVGRGAAGAGLVTAAAGAGASSSKKPAGRDEVGFVAATSGFAGGAVGLQGGETIRNHAKSTLLFSKTAYSHNTNLAAGVLALAWRFKLSTI